MTPKKTKTKTKKKRPSRIQKNKLAKIFLLILLIALVASTFSYFMMKKESHKASKTVKIDNIIITGEAITGIGEIANSVEPFVFPNPSAGTFVVRNLENISGIKVFDTKGRLLEEIKNSLENEITIEGLLPGVYFINCYDKNGQVRSIKTVVN